MRRWRSVFGTRETMVVYDAGFHKDEFFVIGVIRGRAGDSNRELDTGLDLDRYHRLMIRTDRNISFNHPGL